MDDRLRRLQGFATTGQGIEIAPYFNPVLLKSECDVLYTDYIDNDEIAEKAAANPTLNGRIPPRIDFVWTPGAPLKDCAPAKAKFDFAYASHVMEHVPNPIGWLNDILECVRPGGVLRLILPDKRTNNDYFRHDTTFAELLALWLERPACPTPAQVADFTAYVLDDYSRSGFAPDGTPLNPKRSYHDGNVMDFATLVYNADQYIDVHCTAWTPEGFVEVIRRCAEAGIINVDARLVQSHTYEFIVDLTNRGAPKKLPPPKRHDNTSTDSVIVYEGVRSALRRSLHHRWAELRRKVRFTT